MVLFVLSVKNEAITYMNFYGIRHYGNWQPTDRQTQPIWDDDILGEMETKGSETT